MLRRRNFNIDSLQVGHSEAPGISRMTFVVDGDDRMVDQVIKQMRKVVDVTGIENFTDRPMIAREMALIRVQAKKDDRAEVVQLADMMRGEVVDVALDSLIVQIVGSTDRVDTLIELLDPFGITEMVRTGPVAMLRGSKERRRKRSSAIWRASSNGIASAEESNRFATGGV
jgi:acetolactate synthase-1/3 small subunit